MLKLLLSRTAAISVVLCSTIDAFSATNSININGQKRISSSASKNVRSITSITSPTLTSHHSMHPPQRNAVLLQLSNQNDNNMKDNNNNNDDEDEVETNMEKPMLSLPPIGESSYSSSFDLESHNSGSSSTNSNANMNANMNMLNNDQPKAVGSVGSRKFELQYTCNVCETRNVHKVSRLAYTKGVVITVCKGCMTKHLIADNLEWSKFWGEYGFEGKTNIEEYMEERGRGDEVNRVSRDVFHLEQILDDGNGKSNSNGSSCSGIVSSPIVDDADAFE